MQEHIAEMKRRTDLGEFGTPADTILVHEAWARILAFEGRTRDNLEIPKGSKIIAFYNRSDSEGVPHFNLVWVVNEN